MANFGAVGLHRKSSRAACFMCSALFVSERFRLVTSWRSVVEMR